MSNTNGMTVDQILEETRLNIDRQKWRKSRGRCFNPAPPSVQATKPQRPVAKVLQFTPRGGAA